MTPIINRVKISLAWSENILITEGKVMSQKIKQDNKKHNIYKVLTALAIIVAIVLIAVYETNLKKETKDCKSDNMAMVEENLTPAKLDLMSMQNGREIRLTKFMATKKKFIFDYQFKLDDERLKELLNKQLAAGSNYQSIRFSLFADSDKSNDLVGGGISFSTFRIEGDTFYGTVNFTYDSKKLPDDTNLTLQISQLSWEDWDERRTAEAEANVSEAGSSFTVPTALQYDGEWRFDITYQPLRQTGKPQITQVNNIEDIKADSDALQTTVAFTIPVKAEAMPDLEIYKDCVKIKTPSFTTKPEGDKTQFKLSFDMSVLDKTSVYKIQVNIVDEIGQQATEIGTFDMQNKVS